MSLQEKGGLGGWGMEEGHWNRNLMALVGALFILQNIVTYIEE